jgi:hypothetical protein
MSCLHRGPYIQRGRGIGSSLTAMFKGAIPALKLFGEKIIQSPVTKEIVKTAKRSALDAGLNVASDLLKGKKIKQSVSENVDTAKKAVTNSLVTALEKAKVDTVGKKPVVKSKKMSGKRGKKQVTFPTTRKSRKRKSKTYDIFEENFV